MKHADAHNKKDNYINMNIQKQFIKYVSQNICGMLGISCYIIVDTFFISQAAKRPDRNRQSGLAAGLYEICECREIKENICNYSEPCEIEGKSATHACMNEHFSPQFHMARSHIEM